VSIREAEPPASTSRYRAVRCAAVVVASMGVAALTLTAAGTAAQASTGTAKPPLHCSATVTRRHPPDDTTVGIRVTTTRWAHVVGTAHFKRGNRVKTARSDRSGRATIWYAIGRATPGYRVSVQVSAYRDGRRGSCSTSFFPSQVRRPHRRRHHRGGAWCKATASVYNAEYDWNNVYVHSNQPYTDATASADGYSWSYETNGNGYALIYLNGPPPGAEITVTVGAAVCYTSD
jgi:hypothetical protein